MCSGGFAVTPFHEDLRVLRGRQSGAARGAAIGAIGCPRSGAPVNRHVRRPRPLTVNGAHLIWQAHRHCRIDGCPQKAAALVVLVEAGKVRLDSSRLPYLEQLHDLLERRRG